MPSFRCKIKKLRFHGILTDKETKRILDALDKAEKTAEWITKWDEEEREERHYCTNCNKYQLFQTEFCSNCGAKMKGESDGKTEI